MRNSGQIRANQLRSRCHRGKMRGWLSIMMASVVIGHLTTMPAIAQSDSVVTGAAYKEERGTLPDGTSYIIRVPNNWNGVLIRDLDIASSLGISWTPESPTNPKDAILNRGYALAGTARHVMRMYQYDPRREISNLDLVLDKVDANFGKPKRVIQMGCSGGGHVTLAVSEDFSDRIDGSVALAAHTPVWLMNSFFDGWFALKALIGPGYVAAGGNMEDLAITGMPNDGSSHASAHGLEGDVPAAWRKAVRIAQESPQGRAQLVLAFTIGQWPAWMSDKVTRPDLNNPEELQKSIYYSADMITSSPGGEARVMFENAAYGQQLSWNDNVDYAKVFEMGNPHLKAAVRALYKKAGADLDADIAKVNGAPRIKASPYALDFWKQPGRTTDGNPKIPVLRLHMVDDYQIPPSLVEGYEAEVKRHGKEDLVRTAYVNSTGHCNFSTAEQLEAIDTMMKRLDTGKWPGTTPAELNKRAAALDTDTTARFMDYNPYRQGQYARIWAPNN
jgi:dienelactone hydrolase